MEAIKIRPSLSISRVSSSVRIDLYRRFSSCHFVAIPVIDTRKKKISVSMCLSENSLRNPGFEANATLKYTEDKAEQLMDEPMKSYRTVESTNGKVESTNGKVAMNVHPHEDKVLRPKTYALIHDFCLGIPFGAIVFGGGLFGFLFSRNVASLTTGGLLGGSILALGILSLKVWRQGLPTLPFILGQAVLTATLFWKYLPVYSLSKKFFPSGFYVAMSVAMICFYSYVLVSGGNPPPKRKKLATASPS